MRRLSALVLLMVALASACGQERDELRPVPPVAGIPADPGHVSVHVPPNPSGIGVVVLHSLGHTGTEPARQGWSAAADRYGFVAIYPSRGDSWNAGLCCGSAAASGRDDVNWLASTIADARRRYGLQAIYLAGFSNGGMMAERLVAEVPSVSDRLVTWGAAPEMPQPGHWTGSSVLYSGEFDHTVPAAGGNPVLSGWPTVIRPSVTTGWWLPDSHMQWFVIPGAKHEPPADWPDLAWRALRAVPGPAPRS